jgi:hypothetical protein
MDNSDKINIISAISNSVLAVVAIFGETIKSWIYSPRIEIFLNNQCGDFTNMANEIDRFNSAYCYHLSIINKKPKSVANNCYVQIVQIDKLTEKGRKRIDLNVPVYIRWVPNELREFTINLSHERQIDFGYLKKGGNAFTPWLQTYPNNFKGHVESETTLIYSLQVFADSYKSEIFEFSVYWNGVFDENPEQMSKNLVIKKYGLI